MREAWHGGTSLRQWRLHNFKSARDASVELAPLTVVVGENSAGKSTLLQSIRAVVQAVGATGSAFPLNGDQVRLGTYQETRSAGAPDDDRQIGIGGVFFIGDHPQYATPVRYGRGRGNRREPGAVLGRLEWDIRLGGSPPEQPGQTILRSSQITLRTDDEPPLSLQSSDPADRAATAEPTFSGSWTQRGQTHELAVVEHRGGFPYRGYQDTDLVEHLTDLWVEAAQILSLRSAEAGTGRPQPARAIAALAAEDVRAVMDDAGQDRPGSWALPVERRMRIGLRQRLSERGPLDIQSLLTAREDVRTLVAELVDVRLRTLKPAELPDELREATDAVQEFLATRVLHLGPLRMDPQVVYTTAPVGRSGYIGTKGEYCAAVLQTNGRAHVGVPLPDRVGTRNVPLGVAVNQWAAALGIGEEFSTADKGRLGLELAVRQPGVDIPLDLTSVGTGVSQLLPVLVMCLQAPAGSLLLLEQPELHLNPAVQQRLADFLLAVAGSGRQLIVETHSDYLVTRLRRRVAEAARPGLAGQATVVFAERSADGTVYRPFPLEPDASLPAWPAGFFDQAAEDAEALLHAVLRRRGQQHPEHPDVR